MKKAAMRIVTTRLPVPLAQKVDEISERLDRSKGWILQQALVEWIEREQERINLTLEGLEDVDSGHVVDHSRVQAWADSLTSHRPLPPPTRSK